MPTPMPRGRIVWYECMTSDRERALAFYSALLGWTATPSQAGNMDYTMLAHGGAPFGGMLPIPADAAKAGAPSQWIMYVGTPSVDDTLAAAVKLGAKAFVQPQDIPGMGRFAVLADPQGATFAIFTAVEPAGDPANASPDGEVLWNELATTDVEAAFRFYSSLFDWEKRQAMDMGPHGIYQLWGRPGQSYDLGGIYPRMPEMPVSSWCFYFRVKGLDAATARAKSLGATVMREPMEVPGGSRIAVFADPCGAVFALNEPA